MHCEVRNDRIPGAKKVQSRGTAILISRDGILLLWERFLRAIAPLGLLVLRATGGNGLQLNLDHFLVFSPFRSIWGIPRISSITNTSS